MRFIELYCKYIGLTLMCEQIIQIRFLTRNLLYTFIHFLFTLKISQIQSFHPSPRFQIFKYYIFIQIWLAQDIQIGLRLFRIRHSYFLFFMFVIFLLRVLFYVLFGVGFHQYIFDDELQITYYQQIVYFYPLLYEDQEMTSFDQTQNIQGSDNHKMKKMIKQDTIQL